MKKTRILIISFLILFGIISDGLALYLAAQQQSEVALPTTDATDSLPLFVPAEILVTFRPNVTPDQIQALNEAQGMTILEMNQGMGIYRLRVSRPVKEAVALVQSQPFVEYARPNYILAVVGGTNITLLDMESVIEQINPFLRRIYTRNEAKETLLNSLVDYKLFSMVARDENLDKLPDVNRKINAAVEKTLAQAYTGKIGESLSVSEKELRDYYEFHLKEFQTPEQIKVRHIVVKTEEEAEMVLEMIKAGAQFDMIAREWSIDVTAKSGGELGWVGRERMPPALEKAAFALDKGEVSGIVKTGFGYHMIKLEDRRDPGVQTFSDVGNRIKQTLWGRKQKENTEKKRKELQERYKTKVYTESLSEVRVHKIGETDQRYLMRTLQEMLQEMFERPY